MFDLDLHGSVVPGCALELRGPELVRSKLPFSAFEKGQGREGAARRSMPDVLQAAFESHDAFALAFACELFAQRFHVVRVDNRLKSGKVYPEVRFRTQLPGGVLATVSFILTDAARLQEQLHLVRRLVKMKTSDDLSRFRGSTLPVVLVLGPSGAGKSELCRAISGDDRFGSTACSRAGWAEGTVSRWFGQPGESRFIVVDTPGVLGAGGDGDLRSAGDGFRGLGLSCIVLAISSEQRRLDRSFILLMQAFESIFGPSLWDCVVLAFTRWYQDEASATRRGRTDEWPRRWTGALCSSTVHLAGSVGEGGSLPAVFVDSCAATRPDTDKVSEGQLLVLRDLALGRPPLEGLPGVDAAANVHMMAEAWRERRASPRAS